MDDIVRQDRRTFLRVLIEPARVVLTTVMAAALIAIFGSSQGLLAFVGVLTVLGVAGFHAYFESVDRRWINEGMRSRWKGVEDRMARFNEAVVRLRKDQIADLQEMPDSIRRTSQNLYAALRRADMIAQEVGQSERGLYNSPPVWQAASHDPQSKELYRIADKNIAEYRQQFSAVMAGVQRTEAQAAVFMTTLDTLRMKMVGYRLVGRSPEMRSDEFLNVLAEARAQLQSIDTALEELDLGHYPQRISVVPPPPPEEALRRIQTPEL
ncbi:hypothetical protein EON81_23170 [bacterium]|nr:MAG: hypothetical protein EON81_23170 [bacterium]